MHESVVAQSIFETISSHSREQNAKPVSARITSGTFNAVNPELLKEAFVAIARDTICEGVELKIEKKSLQGKCLNCQKTFDYDIATGKCSECDSEQVNLLPDPPLILEEIEFETE
jgi:hydrogenase nickel incorporation protein HypA/HybF